jgi:hypothetical protein
VLAFLLLLSLISGSKSQEPSAALPRGQLVEKVTCASDPNQSYALYLPSNYDKNRKWPVLYALDPGARGAGWMKFPQCGSIAVDFAFATTAATNLPKV